MIFVLDQDIHRWPDPESDSTDEGIVAVGGDLRTERLLEAYRRGIFPWYSQGLPILWHCPEPRFVLDPEKIHVPQSLKKVIKRGAYEVRFDTQFEAVISACAHVRRPGQRGTWITRDMHQAYVTLHREGWAHSAESFFEGKLAGGLYGVCVGDIFFGESMFALAPDASKVAFATLVESLRQWGIKLIDCQQDTAHLRRFGAEGWPRKRFLEVVAQLTQAPSRQGPWPPKN